MWRVDKSQMHGIEKVVGSDAVGRRERATLEVDHLQGS